MDLHLRIATDLAASIEIDLHAGPDTAGRPAELDCRSLAYEEIGGEAFNADRRRWHRSVEPGWLEELERLLPRAPLGTPSEALTGFDGPTFTLTIGSAAEAVEYTWSSHLPPEWEPLREIVRLLVTAAGVDLA